MNRVLGILTYRSGAESRGLVRQPCSQRVIDVILTTVMLFFSVSSFFGANKLAGTVNTQPRGLIFLGDWSERRVHVVFRIIGA